MLKEWLNKKVVGLVKSTKHKKILVYCVLSWKWYVVGESDDAVPFSPIAQAERHDWIFTTALDGGISTSQTSPPLAVRSMQGPGPL